MKQDNIFRVMSPQERRQYRNSLMREMLWAFFRPLVCTWGFIAVIAALFFLMK